MLTVRHIRLLSVLAFLLVLTVLFGSSAADTPLQTPPPPVRFMSHSKPYPISMPVLPRGAD